MSLRHEAHLIGSIGAFLCDLHSPVEQLYSFFIFKNKTTLVTMSLTTALLMAGSTTTTAAGKPSALSSTNHRVASVLHLLDDAVQVFEEHPIF